MGTRTIRWRTVDAAAAAVLTVAAVGELAWYGYGFLPALCACLGTGALAWRRHRPLAVLAVGAVSWTVPILLGLVPGQTIVTPLVALLLAVYSVARHAGLRPALTGAAVATAAALASNFRLPDAGIDEFGFTVVLISWPWFAGWALRNHALAHAALLERAALLEADRDYRAAAAVTAERARIARELHDIVAHCVSVMVLQAAAAGEVVERDPARAKDVLQAVGATGRDALVELRRLLTLMRTGNAPPALSPQPGLADLDALTAQVRAAGLPVRLTIEGDPDQVPPSLGLAAFRIVQEGLTNALKHAGPAQAEVVVLCRPDVLSVTVSDDGRGCQRPRDPVAAEGQGLAGVRERVGVYGGILEAGAASNGGFRLAAELPMGVGRSTPRAPVDPTGGAR